MRRLFWIFLVAATATAACHRSAQTTTTTQPSPTADLLHEPLPIPDYKGLGSILLQKNPPCSPRCPLDPLFDATDPRYFLQIDLNQDGTPEYLVESSAGAHSMCFVIVDAHGKLLMRRKDMDNDLGGDRILILKSTHHGYSDILTSDSDLSTVLEIKWTFNGRYYVPGPMFTLNKHARPDPFVLDKSPAKLRAAWYCDIFSAPLAK